MSTKKEGAPMAERWRAEAMALCLHEDHSQGYFTTHLCSQCEAIAQALAAAHKAGALDVIDAVLAMIDPLPFCRGLMAQIEALRATEARHGV